MEWFPPGGIAMSQHAGPYSGLESGWWMAIQFIGEPVT